MMLPVLSHMNYGPMRMLLYRAAPTLTVMSDLLPDKIDGVYIRSEDLILIDRRMSYTRKRCTLVHELVHRQYGDDTKPYHIKYIANCRPPPIRGRH